MTVAVILLSVIAVFLFLPLTITFSSARRRLCVTYAALFHLWIFYRGNFAFRVISKYPGKGLIRYLSASLKPRPKKQSKKTADTDSEKKNHRKNRRSISLKRLIRKVPQVISQLRTIIRNPSRLQLFFKLGTYRSLFRMLFGRFGLVKIQHVSIVLAHKHPDITGLIAGLIYTVSAIRMPQAVSVRARFEGTASVDLRVSLSLIRTLLFIFRLLWLLFCKGRFSRRVPRNTAAEQPI